MENLDFEVREHSPSAATTSQIASVQEVCDPLQVATGSPHSVLFEAWILLSPACDPMRGRKRRCGKSLQALVRGDKIKLYQWLFQHTKNEAGDVLVLKGTANIENIMGGIQSTAH